MTDRTRLARTHSLLVLAATLAMLAGSASARQSITANDPVALPQQTTAKPATETDTPGIQQPPPRTRIEVPPANNTPPSPSVTGSSTPAVTAKPANESKSLGKPNSALSARPIVPADGPASSGWLSRLDPRSNEIVRMIVALSLVIGVLFGMRSLIRRMGISTFAGGAARPSGVVEILARYPVNRGQSLVLLKLARRIVLLHQSGSTMTTLTELTDADEVASVLTRMEAGASGKDAARFQAALTEFSQEHQALENRPARGRALPRVETEVVDLTRGASRGLGSLLGRKVAR